MTADNCCSDDWKIPKNTSLGKSPRLLLHQLLRPPKRRQKGLVALDCNLNSLRILLLLLTTGCDRMQVATQMLKSRS
jgi:hypothetical protein